MSVENKSFSFQGLSSDFLDYCPFVLGMSKSELGLRKINEQQELRNELLRDRQFQIDETSYDLYLKSKQEMRRLHPEEDYKSDLSWEEQVATFTYMASRLALEYPEKFTFKQSLLQYQGKDFVEDCLLSNDQFEFKNNKMIYRDGIDFIAHHIQEDFCLVNVKTLEANLIHLSSPNDWTAKWGLGKNFDDIHLRTPRAFEIVKRPEKIFNRLFSSRFLYERLGAMTLTSYSYLLRHPSHKETPISTENLDFYFRFERQTLKAIPNSDLLLFTIRPYLMDFTERVKQEITLEQVSQMVEGELENRYAWFFKANSSYFKNLFT